MASGSALKTYHATLSADTVDTATLILWSRYVLVINKSSTDLLYVTTDGTTPAVEADDTYCVLPGDSKLLFNEGVQPEPALGISAGVVVKLISSGDADYGVEKN